MLKKFTSFIAALALAMPISAPVVAPAAAGHNGRNLEAVVLESAEKTQHFFDVWDPGMHPHFLTPYGWSQNTPLHLAADRSISRIPLGEQYFERQRIIRILLEHGADTTVVNRYGETPLHIAAYWDGAGNSDIPRMMMDKARENGVDLNNLLDSRGNNILHVLLKSQPVTDLIAGTNPRHTTSAHSRALGMAAMIRRGVNPFTPDHEGDIPMAYAFQNSHLTDTFGTRAPWEMVRATPDNLLRDFRDENGINPLLIWSLYHGFEISNEHRRYLVQHLTRRNVGDPLAQDPHGVTALHLAPQYDGTISNPIHDGDFTRFLLNKIPGGTDINIESARGLTPLHYAAKHPGRGNASGHPAAVRLLLARGANPAHAAPQSHGVTPLDTARRAGRSDIVAIMEDHLKTPPPLHKAAAEGNLDEVRRLLDGGADVHEFWTGIGPDLLETHVPGGRVDLVQGPRNHTNLTPLMHMMLSDLPRDPADDSPHVQVIEFLVGRGADPDLRWQEVSPRGVARLRGSWAAYEAAMDRGIQARAPEPEPEPEIPPLIALIFSDDASLEDIRAALAAADDLGAVDHRGRTALHAAVASHRADGLEVVEMLLDAGADIHAANQSSGNTALHFAAAAGNLEIARLLLARGADRLVRNGANLLPADLLPGEMTPDTAAGFAFRFLLAGIDDASWGIRAALEAGANPNEIGPRGQTPLHAVIASGRADGLELVGILLDAGAYIHAPDSGGNTALHHAAIAGDAEIAWLLLTRGADRSTRNGEGLTAAELAPDTDGGFAVRVRLAQDLNIAVAGDECNYNFLHRAVADRNVSRVRMLLELGADQRAILRGPAYGDSPDHCLGGFPVQMAASHPDPDPRDLEIIGLLIGAGTDVRNVAAGTPSALHLAAKNARPELIAFLLNNGADIEQRGAGDRLPDEMEPSPEVDADRRALAAAVMRSWRRGERPATVPGETPEEVPADNAAAPDESVEEPEPTARPLVDMIFDDAPPGDIRAALDAGADLEEADPHGRTPLLVAIISRHADGLELVEMLLDAGADIHATHSSGNTALHFAAFVGNAEIVRLLMERGADPAVRNSENRTPADLAPGGEAGSAVRARLAAADEDEVPAETAPVAEEDVHARDELGLTHLHRAASHGDLARIESLLERGADIDARADEIEATPLLFAASNARVDAVALLLERGADIALADVHEQTVLYFGIVRNRLEIVRMALEAGADPDRQTLQGEAPIHTVMDLLKIGAFPVERALEILELLAPGLDDWNAVNPDGNSLAHLAVATRDENLVRFLLDQGVDFVGLRNRLTNGTGLDIARGMGLTEIVRLLEPEAPDDAEAPDWNAALIEAIRQGDADAADAAIQNGANANGTDEAGVPILILARMVNFPEIGLLLPPRLAGADPNVSYRGANLVHYLANNGADEPEGFESIAWADALRMAQDLAFARPDWNAVDERLHTPLDYLSLRAGGLVESAPDLEAARVMAEIVRRYGGRCSDSEAVDAAHPICTGEAADDAAALAELLRGGGDAPETADAEALVEMIRQGDAEALAAALQNGSDPNGADRTGVPLLFVAWLEKRPRLAEALLEGGADPDAEHDGKSMPHHLAVNGIHAVGAEPHLNWADVLEIAARLADAGADFNRPGAGYTALDHLPWRIETAIADESDRAGARALAALIRENGGECSDNPYVDRAHPVCTGEVGEGEVEVELLVN